jgi:hypothetical protein
LIQKIQKSASILSTEAVEILLQIARLLLALEEMVLTLNETVLSIKRGTSHLSPSILSLFYLR